jgi:hypothetical protein
MSPRGRKLALVAHVGSSVGWLGAVVTSLALAVVALASRDAALVRAVYLVLEPLGWFTLIPFSLAALLTGLIQSLGTSWGLIRHYWVLAKLLMNLFATGILLLYMQTLAFLADTVRATAATDDVDALRNPSPVVHAVAAVALLLVALVLSVYKPRGQTPYGQRKQSRQRARPDTTAMSAIRTAPTSPVR